MIETLNEPIYDRFMALCGDAAHSIELVSPFLKGNVFEDIEKQKKRDTAISLVTNLTLRNVSAGSTDIAAVRTCLAMAGRSYNKSNLHAKIYVFDRKRAIVTSANLTNNGLHHNYEYGIYIDDEMLVDDIYGDIKSLQTEDAQVSLQNLNEIEKLKQQIYVPDKKIITIDADDFSVLLNDEQKILEQLKGGPMHTFEIICKLPMEFTLKEANQFIPELQKLYPNNTTVDASLRRNLQVLRDLGLIEFLGNGQYRKSY